MKNTQTLHKDETGAIDVDFYLNRARKLRARTRKTDGIKIGRAIKFLLFPFPKEEHQAANQHLQHS